MSLPPRPGRLHLMKLLEVLARVEPQDCEPFALWVQRASLPPEGLGEHASGA